MRLIDRFKSKNFLTPRTVNDIMPTHVPDSPTPHRNDPPVPPFYRQFWFWMVMLPLITSVILSSIMVKTAFQLGDDVVVGEYYKEGRMLNDRLQSNQAAAAAGLAADVRFDLDVGEILITVSRNDGQPLPEKLALFLDHPVSEARDRRFSLIKITEGYYRADLKKGLQHRWYVRLEPEFDRGNASDSTPPTEAQSNQGDQPTFWRLSGELNVNEATHVRLLPKS